MGKLVLSVAATSIALLVACNALSGVDGLTSQGAGEEQAEVGTPKAPTSAMVPGRDHGPTMGESSSGTSGSATPGDDGGIDAASEAAAGLPTFTDDFNRPDGPVGNGWIEKTPGQFPLIAGAAQQSAGGIYRNLFVARPTSEDVANVLVQATVTFAVSTADPCLFARIQPVSVQKDRFVGYSVYPDGPNNLYISRDDGSIFNDVGSAMISPALVVGQSYHLALQVTGTNPVHLAGSISKLDGTVIAAITTNDASGKRVTNAGSVGFGSSASVGGRFDDFRRVTLP